MNVMRAGRLGPSSGLSSSWCQLPVLSKAHPVDHVVEHVRLPDRHAGHDLVRDVYHMYVEVVWRQLTPNSSGQYDGW